MLHVDDLDNDDPQTHASMEHFRCLGAMLAGSWSSAYAHGLVAGEFDWLALPTAARAAVQLGDASRLDALRSLGRRVVTRASPDSTSTTCLRRPVRR